MELDEVVKEIKQKYGKEKMDDPETKRIISIVQSFLRSSRCIMYGGTALNELLPPSKKFYDKTYEFPDYDVFMHNPIEGAKTLVDMLLKAGIEAQSKAGLHFQTYRVYINQVATVDITYIPLKLYDLLVADGRKMKGVQYAPVNFLRMSMYSELSRPKGNIDRWPKIFERLTVFNQVFPLKEGHCSIERGDSRLNALLYNALQKHDVVFIGSVANNFHLRKPMPVADFDVLSTAPMEVCNDAMQTLSAYNPTIISHPPVGELLNVHFTIQADNVDVLRVYVPNGCSSYLERKDHNGRPLKIGTINTLMTYYLSLVYAKKAYIDEDQMLCWARALYKPSKRTKKLPNFPAQCYGREHTAIDSRRQKNKMRRKLEVGSREFEKWFFEYPKRCSKKRIKTGLKG